MLASPELRAELRTLMQRGAQAFLSDTDFDRLALAVFRHQYDRNRPYRRYCERRGRTPDSVSTWTDVPAVPTAAFKEVVLVAGEASAAPVVFRTSGTTRGAERRGVHYLLDPGLYDASLLPTFRHFVLHDAARMRMLSLIPPYADQKESSLSYMASVVVRELGAAQSGFFVGANGLQVEPLRNALALCVSQQQAVCLLGTSLAFAHLIEQLQGDGCALPAGSRLMDTGGFKGERRTYDAQQLRAMYRATFAIPGHLCINEYGMTELCSQYYDARSDGERSIKKGPPWLRARVVDPDTLHPMPPGEVGILQHYDLANLDSVSAVLTEDLAYQTEDGFVLLGRAPNAMPRGCSIAMDIMLSSTRE